MAGISTSEFPAAYVAAALGTAREKGKLFKDLAPFVGFYFVADEAVVWEAEARAKALTATAKPILEKLRTAFADTDFSAVQLEAALKTEATAMGVKVSGLVQPVRVACTGTLVGPSLYHLMEVLGRERVDRRLARAAAVILA